MVASKYIAIVAVAFASATSASAVEGDWALALLKRQQLGTPAYACHEACGNSITLSRGASPCTDDSFLSNYAACLACAGPDNINIWRYYSATLSAAGTRCGLSTTPASGSSGGGGSSSTTSSTAAASSTPAPTSQAPSTTTAAPAGTSSTPVSPPSSPVSEPPAAGTTASQTASAIPSSSAAAALPTTTAAPSGTLPAGNGTATTTTSSSAQFTGAASHQQIIGWGAVGVAVLAILA